MPLLELPIEIQVLILSCLGSSFFHSNVSRLTVSKQWFTIAQRICLKELNLTEKNIKRLHSNAFATKSFKRMQDSVEVFSITLQGYQDWGVLPVDRISPQKRPVTWGQELSDFERWALSTRTALRMITEIMKSCRKLRKICLKAWPERQLIRWQAYPSFLLAPIEYILPMECLTTLELDLADTFCQFCETTEALHFCPDVAALLPRLKSVRLRLRDICPKVLTLPEGITLTTSLTTVIVNLRISAWNSIANPNTFPQRCGENRLGGTVLEQLKADMELQAKVLADQMESPKMVRVLKQCFAPTRNTVTLDVLTGKYMILDDDAEKADWSDNGREWTEDDPPI